MNVEIITYYYWLNIMSCLVKNSILCYDFFFLVIILEEVGLGEGYILYSQDLRFLKNIIILSRPSTNYYILISTYE